MKQIKEALAWVIGYFVLLSPVHFALDGSLIMGLIQAIVGVLGAIIILKKKNLKGGLK